VRIPYVLALAIALLGAACSHYSPYYGLGASPGPGDFPALDQVRQRVLLIGDAGMPQKDEPVLQALEQWARQQPQRTRVVFLGDNVYENGIAAPDRPGYGESVGFLQAQIDAVKHSSALAFFVPGNHDWGKGGEEGQAALARQEALVQRELPGSGGLWPSQGCPGPASLDLDGMRLIALDTQWWLRREAVSIGHCPCQDSAAVLAELERLLASAGDRQVLVLAHHPLASHGPHGGFFDWKDHLFPTRRLHSRLWLPLPLLGSLYPLARRQWPPSQDLASPAYRSMSAALRGVLARHRPLIYAAGHDHNLQVMEGDAASAYYLVSGSGSAAKATAVTHGDNTLFAHLHPGFMAIDLLEDGRVFLRVVEPEAAAVVFARWLRGAE
jgi:hypothetical protein